MRLSHNFLVHIMLILIRSVSEMKMLNMIMFLGHILILLYFCFKLGNAFLNTLIDAISEFGTINFSDKVDLILFNRLRTKEMYICFL